MALSNDILNRVIPGAATEANTLNKVFALSDNASPVAKIALSTQSIGLFIRNILGDLSTSNIAALREQLYGSDIQTFSEITSDTSGIGVVPIGTTGSPQPLLDGHLLSFGRDGKKLQILAFNNNTLWIKINEDSAGVNSQWHVINQGIVDRRFWYHTGNNATRPSRQVYRFDVHAHARSARINLWGAGGGGGASWVQNITRPRDSFIYKGEDANDSLVRYYVNDSLVFTLTAKGGVAGNSGADIQTGAPIPDDNQQPTHNPTNFTINGAGMPGGISEKFINIRSTWNRVGVIPQDGLPGALAVRTFDITTPGRFEIRLAAGGRNYDTFFNTRDLSDILDSHDLNSIRQRGSPGKAAAAEITVW